MPTRAVSYGKLKVRHRSQAGCWTNTIISTIPIRHEPQYWGMAGERLQLVEKSGAAHVLHATEHVHTETGVVDILHDAFPYGGHEFPVPGIVAVRRNLSDSVLKTGVCPSEQCPVCQYVPDIRPEHVYAKRFGDIGVSSVFQPLQHVLLISQGGQQHDRDMGCLNIGFDGRAKVRPLPFQAS